MRSRLSTSYILKAWKIEGLTNNEIYSHLGTYNYTQRKQKIATTSIKNRNKNKFQVTQVQNAHIHSNNDIKFKELPTFTRGIKITLITT